ncbi:hypothetical protein [Streptomyces luteogriseus]|uniref:hypothetical protein n=1 Tax=Streptomyces luteogriseus TaxID=68233 RepID=UPI002E36C2F4|nr:hypothetical protein [Streptomyces luteogriseus]WTJ31203.1 hypothetical protein OID52_31170 [Streptomyces luteogriseus]
MGIRTLLSRTAPGVALPPVQAFEAAASTVRVPVTFTSALRHATADLRQRLTTRGRRPTGSADTGVLTAATALPGADDLTAAPALTGTDALAALTGLADTDALSALTGLADTDALAALTGLTGADALAALTGLTGTDALVALAGVIGVEGTRTVSDPTAVTGDVPTETRPPCTPEPPGRPSRPWARLARDYLALVLTLLPRPRPAHTAITVYITTTDSVLSERPGGSAPSRWQGQERRGPEPDAAP